MDLGWPEVLLILAIVLIVFGVGRLPQVGSQMGKAIREFRKAQKMDDEDEEKAAKGTTVETKALPQSSNKS